MKFIPLFAATVAAMLVAGCGTSMPSKDDVAKDVLSLKVKKAKLFSSRSRIDGFKLLEEPNCARDGDGVICSGTADYDLVSFVAFDNSERKTHIKQEYRTHMTKGNNGWMHVSSWDD